MIRQILHRIVSMPGVYDFTQWFFGNTECSRRLATHLKNGGAYLVLDAGGGTGNCRPLFPASSTYLLLDEDAEKLRGFRVKNLPGHAILGNVAAIPLRNSSVDVGLCVALSHHVSDGDLDKILRELARVVSGKFVFLDAVERKDSFMSRVLWRYDRGEYPRTSQVLVSALEKFFKVEYQENFHIQHHYLLCVCKPK
jgi:ubiquinone/menaquinone biosynthesis C-methylase UbiE